MAEAKGTDVSLTAPANSIIIAADTMVAEGDTILHKPKDKADAKAILTHLSGKSHMVYTGLCVIYKDAEGRETVHAQTIGTKVVFRSLTEAEIEAYIATGEPMDKAGAYGIQGKGSLLFPAYQKFPRLPVFASVNSGISYRCPATAAYVQPNEHSRIWKRNR